MYQLVKYYSFDVKIVKNLYSYFSYLKIYQSLYVQCTNVKIQ